MPTCRRKRVVLTQPSDELLDAVKNDPHKEVFYLEQTGEIFETYEEYAARMSFYRLKQFQCELTGKSGLDYFQAVESEKHEATTLHTRFSEPLKPVVLKAVQWQVMGRLDHLVEAVYDRFKDRYFQHERVIVDLHPKYYARVERVYPPKYFHDVDARDAFKPTDLTSNAIMAVDDEPPHVIAGDLNLPIKEANQRDDPTHYYYWVHILELEKDKPDKNRSAQQHEKDVGIIGSLMEVKCQMMSRDRLCFSKSILRRFIRDCVDRDAAVASPWTVKPAIAQRYGVDTVMPEETRKGVADIKKGEIDKRRKTYQNEEGGPPTKKQKLNQKKSLSPAEEAKMKAGLPVSHKKDRENREKVERQRLAKIEADRLAAEKKKKKPIRYPTEDLDVRLTDKDKKAGMKIQRPVPSQTALPFNEQPGTFESFLLVWNFLNVYGQPLHLSNFTLDEFEHAIRHNVVDPPCPLLGEVHSTLIYNLRSVPFVKYAAVTSLESNGLDSMHGVDRHTLVSTMYSLSGNWERQPLRSSEGRLGWENCMLSCLVDHATVQSFPRLQEVMTRLLFNVDSQTEDEEPAPLQQSSADQQYAYLCPADRIAILSFMCNLATSSKAIHVHMESCEEQLTALRKEKIEVNRQKKSFQEKMSTLAEVKEEDKEDVLPPAPNGVDEDVTMQDMSELSDASASEGGSESANLSARQKAVKANEMRIKAQTQAHAKQREAARQKAASIKQAAAEHRRLDEEMNKIERRLEGIEREFRKLLGSVRVKPLGRDRFYNRIWWFDGLGSASLVGSGGVAQYGTGRLFIQGPSEFDLELLGQRPPEEIEERRKDEEGEDGMLGSGEWAVYSDLEELDEFVAWLNPKGHRELAVKTALGKWWVHITAGVKKRTADLSINAKLPEARRSMRTKASGNDISREPYMMWVNRRAINSS
ncbi:Chromatin remodeling complex protein [Pleurotus pulmonarius]